MGKQLIGWIKIRLRLKLELRFTQKDTIEEKRKKVEVREWETVSFDFGFRCLFWLFWSSGAQRKDFIIFTQTK